jgi:hypothetical protein
MSKRMNINRQIDKDGAVAAIFDERLPELVPKYISHLEGGEKKGGPRSRREDKRTRPGLIGSVLAYEWKEAAASHEAFRHV